MVYDLRIVTCGPSHVLYNFLTRTGRYLNLSESLVHKSLVDEITVPGLHVVLVTAHVPSSVNPETFTGLRFVKPQVSIQTPPKDLL